MEYKDIDKKIGQGLQNLRKEKGISQKELGLIMGVTPQQIYKYENGKSSITLSSLYKICKNLNISVLELEERMFLSENKNKIKYHILEISKICKDFENTLDIRNLESLQNAIAFIITISNNTSDQYNLCNSNKKLKIPIYFDKKPIFQI